MYEGRQLATLDNPQTRQTKKPGVHKGSYFVSGKRLYYVIDVMADDDIFMIEDCLTNDVRVWDLERFMRVKKRVIHA
jgi:hypothetical protein